MQRLNGSLRDRRRESERGSVSIIVALIIVVLIGCVAIVADVGAVYADRQQLQTGADAGSLAVAQDCARGGCGGYAATAQSYASANLNGTGASAVVETPNLQPSSGQVTVRTEVTAHHLFAPILGIDESRVTARSTATWGAPSGGTALLPLIFSWCEWQAQTGGGQPSGTTPRTILFPKSSSTGCTGTNGLFVPGGFGWLKGDGTGCRATSSVGRQVSSDPGNTPPSSCTVASVASLQGRTVLLPLFKESGGTGNNAWYRVYGYAAFTLTGYHFGGQYSWNKPCSGNDRCIKGYFTRFVDLGSSWQTTSTTPTLGASVVRLIH